MMIFIKPIKVRLYFLIITLLLASNTFAEESQLVSPYVRNEVLSFLDGSSLFGNLSSVNNSDQLQWNHKSSPSPIEFDYRAVDSILFNRVWEQNSSELEGLVRIHLKNKDFLRCSLNEINDNHVTLSTNFQKNIKVDIKQIHRIEFLPASYRVLYDSSYNFGSWKKSNSKAWTEDQGNLVSVFSGSTGTTLPKIDALEVNFNAEWQRSFYLALRFFSDSDGGSYGSEGYHLSFSNNRINLQSNRKVNGRTLRETLGSKMVDSLVGIKTANFRITVHRQKKEFTIWVNGQEVGRWKDPKEEFVPSNNGILFINQGGNSFLKLKELSIAGWNGEYFPVVDGNAKKEITEQYISFKNGDATEVKSTFFQNGILSIETTNGNFSVPQSKISSLHLSDISDQNKSMESKPISSEQLILRHSHGKLSLNLDSISKDSILGTHPFLGKVSIPVKSVKRLLCNLSIKELNAYLDKLQQARRAIKNNSTETALEILQKTNPQFRGWYWKRLRLLALNSQTKEILWFNPHPEIGLNRAYLLGQESPLIFTNSKDGHYALWDGYAKLVDGNYTHPSYSDEELGRMENEKWKKISISQPFWLGKTEVTQLQFQKLMNSNPSKRKGQNLPVEVNWFECKEFCKKLNQKFPAPQGLIWRLPTEAEWEYSCRAGSNGPFCETNNSMLFHNEQAYKNHLMKFAWFDENSENQSQIVGQKDPNDWGFHDMHGNVWEWCLDSLTSNKISLFNIPAYNATDPYSTKGEWRSLKGGSFQNSFNRCRAAYRGGNLPITSKADRGFRLCLGPNLELSNETVKKHHEHLNNQILNLENSINIPLIKVKSGSFLMGSRRANQSTPAIYDQMQKCVYSGNQDGKFIRTNIADGSIDWLIDLNSTIMDLKLSKKSNRVFLGTADGLAHIVDLKTKKVLYEFKNHSCPLISLTIDDDGSAFATIGVDGKIVYRKLNQESPVTSFSSNDYNGTVEHIEISPDGRKILCYGLASNVHIFDLKSGKKSMAFDKSKNPSLLKATWHPNGKYCAVLTPNGILNFVEIKSSMNFKTFNMNLPKACDFYFSENGNQILIITSEGVCSLHDLPEDYSIFVMNKEGKSSKTPDYFFNLKNDLKDSFRFQILKDFISNNSHIKSSEKNISDSPDGRWIITCIDGALRLWRKETGMYVTTLAENLSSPFIDCTFSKDGNSILGKLASGHLLLYTTNQNKVGNHTPEDFFKKMSIESDILE